MLAAILVGGFGKRMKPYTDEVPKCLISVAGKPIIEWQISWLKNHGVEEFLLLVGYRWEKVIEHIGSGVKLGVRVTYVVEDEPLGTGGAIRNASHILGRNDVFIALNGDVITNLNPMKLIEKLNEGFLGVVAAIPLPSPYGILDIEDSKLRAFIEKPQLRDYWINAGVYALRRESLKYFPEKGDLERTAFPAMARDGVMGVVKYTDVFWKSIDTYKDLEEAATGIEKLGGKLW